MKKFNKSLMGYNPNEVNSFLDSVINQVEKIIEESKEKDKKISDLKLSVERYKSIENTLNQSILSAQESTERLKQIAKQESDNIISESRRNANRIISDSLLRAEKIQYEAETLKKNINLFKKRMRNMLEQQIDLVEDMDKENINV